MSFGCRFGPLNATVQTGPLRSSRLHVIDKMTAGRAPLKPADESVLRDNPAEEPARLFPRANAAGDSIPGAPGGAAYFNPIIHVANPLFGKLPS